MAGTVEKKIINIGGKGSSLSPSNLYAISIAQAQLRLDSSALDRLTSANQNQPRVNIPKTLTPEETRASLTFLLNKLLISGSVSATIPVQISELLNSSQSIDVGSLGFDSSGGEDDSSAVLWGISAVLDYKSKALSTIVDAVAVLSCEALKADVAAAFGSINSGDGFVDEDANRVAGDMKVLLTGSNSVAKVDIEAVNKIPKINGTLRESVKLLHSTIRVELNSSPEVGKGGGAAAGEAVGGKLLFLADALRNLGKNSLSRAKLNVESVSVDSLRSDLSGLFGKACPDEESFENTARINRGHVKFVQQVNALIEVVYNVVGWEAVTAFFVLEGGELSESGKESGLPNGEDVKADKKSEKKKKKKKAAIGKGASVITQLMKDSFESKGADSLGKWVECLLSFFNPKSPDFVILLNKVKEIVESNESRRLPKLPKGTRDFSKEQMILRKKAFSIISDVFEWHGGTALETPAFELRETLTGKYGEDSKLIYDLADQGGEFCSLRYDLTVPFARHMAMNGHTSRTRYTIGPVYRRDNPSNGRYREFYQCDFDIAGTSEKMGPDSEVIYILTELFDELNIGKCEIKLNHRKLLDGMLAICGVPTEKFRTISSSIDKLDKHDFQQVKKEMVEEKGLTAEVADKIGLYVKEKGHPLELLSKLKQDSYRFLENEDSKEALADLEILFKALDRVKRIDKVVFDLSLARGLDYYTGVIFEAVVEGATQVGSIAAGGRYDKLIGKFGKKQVPAVGVSLGIERVFTIMEQQQKDSNETIRATETQVLVAFLGDELADALELCDELWSAKLKAERRVHKNIRKHIDRAIKFKIPWMVIVGEQELKQGIVKLKKIETEEEVIVKRERMIEELKTRLK